MPIQIVGGNLVHREIANLRSRVELKRRNIYVTLRYIPKEETQEIPMVFYTKNRTLLEELTQNIFVLRYRNRIRPTLNDA